MSNPTTPFGWQMPENTDLVTDLPADFEVFGQAVATSMQDLLGGTTGQILSKTSATDMDFTWTTPNPGDITGVGVTSPITGGGTSGDVTIGIQNGTTAQLGAVQLENSTSSTSTTTAAVPAAVKSAYDLANGAIAKTTLTTTGDSLYASAANTPERLGIGSTGNVLTVSGGLPVWAAPAAGGTTVKVASTVATAQVTSTTATYVDSGLTVSITPTANTSKVLIIADPMLYQSANGSYTSVRITKNGTNVYEVIRAQQTINTSGMKIPIMFLDSPASTSSLQYKIQFCLYSGSGNITFSNADDGRSSIIVMEIGA